MNVYFAGSIRGGREDAAVYRQIIRRLKRYGHVLTEHVGETERREDDLSDEAIYERDMTWLREANVLVAEVTVPSHGVGYEIARAETLGIPVLCLHRPQPHRQLSALIAGSPAILCEPYHRPDQLDAILGAFLRQHSEHTEHQE
jgi:hypothetical protein